MPFFESCEACCTQTYAPASHIRHNAIRLVGWMHHWQIPAGTTHLLLVPVFWCSTWFDAFSKSCGIKSRHLKWIHIPSDCEYMAHHGRLITSADLKKKVFNRGVLAPGWTESDWLTRTQQTESSSNHLSLLFFTTFFGLLTRWTLKINAVNSENLPAGVPGDFILFIHLFIYFQTKTPLMCLGSFNQKVLCLLLHGGQRKQNPDQSWWWWWWSGGGLFLRG